MQLVEQQVGCMTAFIIWRGTACATTPRLLMASCLPPDLPNALPSEVYECQSESSC